MRVSEVAESGDIQCLRGLLDSGGDPNEAETEEHLPPLLAAIYYHQADAARLLLDAGADMYAPTKDGETPLLISVQRGELETFSLLLKRGYRLDAQRDDADQMLSLAASHGYLDILNWLLAQGVSADTPDFQGCAALTYAAHSDELEAVEALLRAGADPNRRDNDTETPLMWAADHAGNAAVLRALLSAGAEVNATNDHGYTALSWTMRHGDMAMIRVLCEAGAAISSDTLRQAAYNGFTDVVRLLLARGGDAAAADENGQTALDYARRNGHREIVNLLLQAEEDRRLKTNGGERPPPRFSIGSHVRALTGTPREGWIVRTAWHSERGAYGYYIEVADVAQPRKNVSRRYWESDLEIIQDAQ